MINHSIISSINQSINQSIHHLIRHNVVVRGKSERFFESGPFFGCDLSFFPQRLSRLPFGSGQGLPHPLWHIRNGEGDDALGADDEMLEGDKQQNLHRRRDGRQNAVVTMNVHVQQRRIGHHTWPKTVMS